MRGERQLPRPLLDVYEWQDRGSCRKAETILFFEPELGHRVLGKERERAAKGICRRCPVVAQCRSHGLAVEEFGIWGGLTARERDAMRRDDQLDIA